MKELDLRQKEWHALIQAYQKRWEPVATAKSKFDSHLLEVEAVWGRDIVEKGVPLSRLVAELLGAIQDHLEARDPKAQHYDERDREEIKRRREIMFERAARHNDEYKKRFEQVISEIEALLKPHVLQHHR